MVFVVASHTMVVNSSTNPDGTMKRKSPDLPKSDLRGAWRKEDPRLAIVQDNQPEKGAYTYVTKATSVRTHEDHTGSGRRVTHEQVFGEDEPALGFGRGGGSILGQRQKVSGMLTGNRSVDALRAKTDELLASSGETRSYYEPVSTITEKFKSVTTRKPTATITQPYRTEISITPQRAPELQYHAPVYTSIKHKPPISSTTSVRPRAIRVVKSPETTPSTALMPYQKSTALLSQPLGSFEYDDLRSERYRSPYPSYQDLARRPSLPAYRAPLYPPRSPVIPTTFRGLHLIASAHDRDSREYTIPPRRRRPAVISTPTPSIAHITGYTPTTPSTSYTTTTPSSFYRGRRYSLPARPTDVLYDTYDDDYDVYSVRRPDHYVPRTRPSPQVSTVPTRCYSPVHYHSPVAPRRSRAADIEAALEATYMPEPVVSYAGLRSRAAEARSKMDVHKTMLDRYLPIHLGPDKEVGMPELEKYRPVTVPSKVAPYKPAKKAERRSSLPSTPTRVVAPPPPRRAPMSDARKRAREVLCKTKRDPEYFNY